MNSASRSAFIAFLSLSALCLGTAARADDDGGERLPQCACSELSFTLQPGGSHSFNLPAASIPVRIEVAFSPNNGGTLVPSELMYALVNQDASSKQITWIGTNNDGSTSGSSTVSGTTIAHLYGGSSSTVDASLVVMNAATGTLAVTQSSTTTSIPGNYVVKIHF